MKHSKLRVASLALVLAMATAVPSYAKSDQDSTLTQEDIKQIKDLTEAIKKTSEDIDNIYEDNFKKEESKSIRTYSSDTKDSSEKPKIDDSNVTDDSKLTDDSNKSDDSKEEKIEAPKKEVKSKIENGTKDISKKEDEVDSNVKDTSDGPLAFTSKDEAIKNAQKALENESSKNSYDIKKGVDGMYYYTLIEDKSKKDTTEPELKDDVIADVKESTSLVSEDVKSSTTYDYYAKNDIKLPARDASANAKTGVGSVSLALVTLVVSAAGFKASKKFK